MPNVLSAVKVSGDTKSNIAKMLKMVTKVRKKTDVKHAGSSTMLVTYRFKSEAGDNSDSLFDDEELLLVNIIGLSMLFGDKETVRDCKKILQDSKKSGKKVNAKVSVTIDVAHALDLPATKFKKFRALTIDLLETTLDLL